ncbi:UNVERIFIED_CONTAM: hypothetical protein K2H54_068507 [Gekko kuhli]
MFTLYLLSVSDRKKDSYEKQTESKRSDTCLKILTEPVATNRHNAPALLLSSVHSAQWYLHMVSVVLASPILINGSCLALAIQGLCLISEAFFCFLKKNSSEILHDPKTPTRIKVAVSALHPNCKNPWLHLLEPGI